MSGKVRAHIRSNIIGYIALFFALSTGSAVALNGSNTVFTDDIVDNQVYRADVRNDTLAGGGLGAVDLRADSVGRSEVADNSLTRADIANTPSGSDDITADLLDGINSSGFVQVDPVGASDRGSLLSNRVVLVPADPDKHLFSLPRLGDLRARCFEDHADLIWRNSSLWTIDRWQEVNGTWFANLIPRRGLLWSRIPIPSPAERLPSDSATTPAPAGSPSCTGSPSRARTARRAGSRPRQRCGLSNSLRSRARRYWDMSYWRDLAKLV